MISLTSYGSMFDWKPKVLCIILCVPATLCLIRDFSICHDDFDSEPADGVLKEHTFKWVGFVQYIHGMVV
ncbi:hypothetical protein B5X24_HaOG202167 [Helicoverpa armigera]|uniref:Uncharacterized protein n=1 Tax=Helicoverpa armigera TaxID=29058 RepID=A0A2W1C2Q3_HELAM|nr:hypothetical protein B5X24_HaOG202167 [Helicoverpa armigera]